MTVTWTQAILILSGIALVVGGVLVSFRIANAPVEPIPQKSETAPASFTFEIRDTDAERKQGLSGRTDVPSNYGMLFVFPEKTVPGFWMKDMHVPIDMIWLSDDGTILGIEDSVSSVTYPRTFAPPEPVRYVLETRAGEARAQGWAVGTKIDLPD